MLDTSAASRRRAARACNSIGGVGATQERAQCGVVASVQESADAYSSCHVRVLGIIAQLQQVRAEQKALLSVLFERQQRSSKAVQQARQASSKSDEVARRCEKELQQAQAQAQAQPGGSQLQQAQQHYRSALAARRIAAHKLATVEQSSAFVNAHMLTQLQQLEQRRHQMLLNAVKGVAEASSALAQALHRIDMGVALAINQIDINADLFQFVEHLYNSSQGDHASTSAEAEAEARLYCSDYRGTRDVDYVHMLGRQYMPLLATACLSCCYCYCCRGGWFLAGARACLEGLRVLEVPHRAPEESVRGRRAVCARPGALARAVQ